MPPIKEQREFFLRAIAVPAGLKKDEQSGYPTTIVVTDCNGNQVPKKNRFLKDHFPSEDVFKKLFESLTFKLNPEDTATTNQQGLVRIAIGSNIVNRLDKESVAGYGNYTTVVVPSELPIVSGDNSTTTVVTQIRKVSDNSIVASIPVGDRNLYYLEYVVSANIPPPSSQIDNIKAYSNVVLRTTNVNVDPTNANYFNILTHNVLGNTLADDFDELVYEWAINHSYGVGNKIGKLKLFIGNAANTDDNELTDIWQDNVPYNTDRTIKVKISIRRYEFNRAIVHIETNMYSNTISSGTSNIGTTVQTNYALDFVTNVNTQPEEKQFIQRYFSGSAVIDWTSDMKVMFVVDKSVNLASDYVDLHTIFGKAIVNG